MSQTLQTAPKTVHATPTADPRRHHTTTPARAAGAVKVTAFRCRVHACPTRSAERGGLCEPHQLVRDLRESEWQDAYDNNSVQVTHSPPIVYETVEAGFEWWCPRCNTSTRQHRTAEDAWAAHRRHDPDTCPIVEHALVPAGTEWTPAEDDVVAKLTTVNAAAKLYRTVGDVRARRLELGIRTNQSFTVWTKEMDAVLAAFPSNTAAAAELGLTVNKVRLRRYRIKSGQVDPTRQRRVLWTEEMDAVLEACTDEEAATKLGVELRSCELRRRRLNTRNRSARRSQKWTREEDEVILSSSKSEAAAALPHRTIDAIKWRRQQLDVPNSRTWTAEQDADVFNGSAREAAARLGRSLEAVRKRRTHLRKLAAGGDVPGQG